MFISPHEIQLGNSSFVSWLSWIKQHESLNPGQNVPKMADGQNLRQVWGISKSSNLKNMNSTRLQGPVIYKIIQIHSYTQRWSKRGWVGGGEGVSSSKCDER